MASFIVIIGPVPPQELALLTEMAKHEGIAIECKASAEEMGSSLKDVAIGYISYLPCAVESIKELFAYLPIGTNEHYPLFQRTDSPHYPQFLLEFPVTAIFQTPLTEMNMRNLFNTILFHGRLSVQYQGIVSEVIKYRQQKHEFIKLSTALSLQHDLHTLLDLILRESCLIMKADAGSIYIRERRGPGGSFTNKLRFKVSFNYSIDFKTTQEYTIDIDKNRIAGYVAYTGSSLNIRDVYTLDDSVPYKFSKDFDLRFNYRIKSMLTIPLKNVEGEVVGVLQLMNKKKHSSVKLSSPQIVERESEYFSYSDEEFLQSIGALAAVSIERTQLYENIEQIFEGFLSSSIAAIDERDRVTSGHSRRVMGYAMAFVEAVNNAHDGPFAGEHFTDQRKRQFKFAALLHDIGKIGVPEALLNKENRLLPGEFAALHSRIEIVRFQLLSGLVDYPIPWASIEELEHDRLFLEKVNKAGYLSDEGFDDLCKIRDKKYRDAHGEMVSLLSDHDWDALTVRKGNLSARERDVINSHTVSSHRILSKIPWTEELEKIPQIAAHHHEKLDGTGYPDGLTGKEIGLEEKILSVIDIYDAIIAQDRPYKPAMPPGKAIEILHAEVKAGHIDADVVNFFVEENIYKIFFD